MLGDRRLVLFTAQTFLLGMTGGLVMIVANGIFIAEFGAHQLPWTYIASAIAAIVGTPLLTGAVRRHTLAGISMPVWGGYAALALGTWVALEWFGAAWVSVLLLVMFPLGIIVGFFLIGGQAGRVLDLREMKERFPRIVLGFPTGFLISGLLGDVLVDLLGGVHRLLPIVTVTALGLLALILLARHRFPAQLGTVPRKTEVTPRLPLRKLLRNSFVVWLVGYQMLSQLGTQLVEFLMFERAGARYSGSDELGRFVARLLSGVNFVDLIFLLFVAGFLLRRFGLRIGLILNPAVVTLFMVGVVAGGFGPGISSTLVFALLIGARVFDIALNDGATRTSLNTAYQAVPADERLAVQAATEVLGVPLAVGLTGVILLVLQQGLGIGPVGISILTLGVGVVWVAAGWMVFRGYRINLRHGLGLRLLDPVGLELDDPATVEVIDRMLSGDDDRMRWLALTTLGEHPELVDRLEALACSGRSRFAEIAFEQLQELDAERAEQVAIRLRTESTPTLRLGALGYLARRRPALSGEAMAEIARALDADDPATRIAARSAAAMSGDVDLVARVVDDLVDPGDMEAAVAALTATSASLDYHLERVLVEAEDESDDLSERRAIRLLRCIRTADQAPGYVLGSHLRHHNRRVSLAVCQALTRTGGHEGLDELDSLLEDGVAVAARVLVTLETLPDDPRLAVLRHSLHDEMNLVREGVIVALALTGVADLMTDAARRFAGGDTRAIAHAVETMEVHLPGNRARLAVPVLDDRMTDSQRLANLRKLTGVPATDLTAALSDLAEDPEDRWRSPWLAGCAIHAAVVLGLAVPAAERWAMRPEVAEVEAWAARLPEGVG